MRAILLSGGHDSAALLAWHRHDLAITIDYGQASAVGELAASQAIAEAFSVRHVVVRVDCRSIGSGDLAGQDALACAPASDWWPYRNQLLITIAAAVALREGVTELHIGCVKSDGSHFDGTRRFVELLDVLVSEQEGNLRVLAPAVELSTAELVRRSGVHRDVLAWCHSCHVAAFACGRCRGCNKHFQVLRELEGVPIGF